MRATTGWARALMILMVGASGLAFNARLSAQVKTTTEENAGQGVRQVTVERAEVIAVEGNDLFVKMEDGTLRHIANVPESTRVTVDGRELGIHDLKPGMHLQRTVTTTTTPKMITTTQQVTGKVWHVAPPNSVILTMENGENQQFKIPKGQKFNVDGKEVDAWGLKKGMRVSATKVVEEPVTNVERQAKLTGQMPPPPPAPPADTPILVAIVTAPAPPAATPAAAPAELPKTGSQLPLVGLVGLLLLMMSAAIRLWRTAGSRK